MVCIGGVLTGFPIPKLSEEFTDGLLPPVGLRADERLVWRLLGWDKEGDVPILLETVEEFLGGGVNRDDMEDETPGLVEDDKPLDPRVKEEERDDTRLANQSGNLGAVLGLGGITF